VGSCNGQASAGAAATIGEHPHDVLYPPRRVRGPRVSHSLRGLHYPAPVSLDGTHPKVDALSECDRAPVAGANLMAGVPTGQKRNDGPVAPRRPPYHVSDGAGRPAPSQQPGAVTLTVSYALPSRRQLRKLLLRRLATNEPVLLERWRAGGVLENRVHVQVDVAIGIIFLHLGDGAYQLPPDDSLVEHVRDRAIEELLDYPEKGFYNP